MSSLQSPTIQQHSPRIRYEVEGALARLIIDQPQRMNAMALTMWESLPELLARARASGALGPQDEAFLVTLPASDFPT